MTSGWPIFALVGKLSDNPDLPKGVELIVKLLTRSRGLAALDKRRPCGAVVFTDCAQVAGCGLVPVTDAKKVRELVELLVAEVEAGQGVVKVTGKGGRKSAYVKELPGGWLALAEKPELLASLPAIDPLTLLGGLEKEYDAAIRLDLANVPAAWRQPLLAKIRAGVAHEEGRKWGESDKDFAIRKKILDYVETTLTGAIEDLDQAVLGWSLDAAAAKVRVDFSVAAREGTPTAKRFADLPGGGGQFAAFRLPGPPQAPLGRRSFPRRRSIC